ncbi:MAG: sigma-54-dependent Fis family transcriptional regulator [Myxococcaceae bacterium]|nr:sigma-54-dependent Fis family transcriptional regulator [Myxococcaceae bacterium]
MVNRKPLIAYVEDDPNQAGAMQDLLDDSGYDLTHYPSAEAAITALEAGAVHADLVLTDVGLPGKSGLELCAALKQSRPDLAVIVITGDAKVETAAEALRAGAYDYLAKPVMPDLLLPCISRAVERNKLTRELARSGRPAGSDETGLFGESDGMLRVKSLVSRVAASGGSVMVIGETGTGKELVARALHALSPRKQAPFVAINCAALPATLVESELFGYAKGAFTDARSARQGLFIEADGGTLFLDEVAELSLDNQAKLLRALQERKVRPLGSNTELPFDARVVCATHRDLDAEVEAGRFRQDLFFRLNVIRIDLPPLRERGMDIVHLAKRFLDQVCERDGAAKMELEPDLARMLVDYAWPGNVRELENCIERLVAFAQGGKLAVADLPEKIRTFKRERFSMHVDDLTEVLPLEELERRYILRVLQLAKDNRTRAAEMLQIDRRTLHRRLEAWGVPGLKEAEAEDARPPLAVVPAV